MREGEDRTLIVFIKDEKVFGKVLNLGAHASLVEFQFNGIEYVVWMENTDFIMVDDIKMKYIEE